MADTTPDQRADGRILSWVPLINDKMTRWDFIAYIIKRHEFKLGAELGVRDGRCLIRILDMCPNLHMVAVDIWAAQPENMGPETWEKWPHDANYHKVKAWSDCHPGRVTLIRNWTHEAAERVQDRSLDFVFIDADHSTEGVSKDILDWHKKVKVGGFLLGHDSNWKSVRAAIDHLIPHYMIFAENIWMIKITGNEFKSNETSEPIVDHHSIYDHLYE